MLGIPEIILIVLGILVLFGGKRVIEFSRSLGRASVEFKKARDEAEKEWEDVKRDIETSPKPKKQK